MKKLAMALVCLVSLAFFASCTPEGQPVITVLTEDGYVQNNSNVNIGEEVLFGFQMTSAIETNAALATLVIKVDDQDPVTVELTGTTYTYKGSITYNAPTEKEEQLGTSTITATVTDALGAQATATITLNIFSSAAAETLTPTEIKWIRKGSNLQGETANEMAKYGLGWQKRDPYHANIRPLDNCKLYVIENNAAAFEGITTATQKATYFTNLIENSTSVEEYRNISVAANGEKEYNDILAVIDAEGNQHLVLFRKANVLIESGIGVTTTIFGEAK